MRQIGYRIVNSRLQSMARRIDPPFIYAGWGTAYVFRIGRTTNLLVVSRDGEWRKGLVAAATVLRRALAKGFTRAEVDEQLAKLRAGHESSVVGADTPFNSLLVSDVLYSDDIAPTTPAAALAWFKAFAPTVTPAKVLAAMKAEAVPLNAPLIRFQGRRAPQGGSQALRAAWAEGEGAVE